MAVREQFRHSSRPFRNPHDPTLADELLHNEAQKRSDFHQAVEFVSAPGSRNQAFFKALRGGGGRPGTVCLAAQ